MNMQTTIETTMLSTVTVTRILPSGGAIAIVEQTGETAFMTARAVEHVGVEGGDRLDAILIPNKSADVNSTPWFVKHMTVRAKADPEIFEIVRSTLRQGGVYTVASMATEVFEDLQETGLSIAQIAAVMHALETLYASRKIKKAILLEDGRGVRTWYTAEDAFAVDLDVFEDGEAMTAPGTPAFAR